MPATYASLESDQTELCLGVKPSHPFAGIVSWVAGLESVRRVVPWIQRTSLQD